LAYDFPNSPTVGQQVTGTNGEIYQWDGTKWIAAPMANPTAPPASTLPIIDGIATTGVSLAYARADHVHPAIPDIGRDKLHNPLFNIAQRGTAVVSTSGGYPADRWMANANLDTIAFQVFALNDAARTQIGDETAVNGLGNTFTGNAGAAAVNYLEQRIESVRRLSGKTVTLSFWTTASAALKLGINLVQVFGTGGSPSGPVTALATGASVNVGTSYARVTATIALPSAAGMTFGTNGNDYTALRLYYSSGATNNAQAGNIGVQSGTINIWGVQLEIGSAATPLEKPDPRYDLSNCQRFFFVGNIRIAAYQGAGSNINVYQSLPTSMRAVPTLTPNFTTVTNLTGQTLAILDASSFYSVGAATALGVVVLIGSYTASADL
jgi:hypothetical protein